VDTLTKNVRHLEAAFGKLVVAAREAKYFSEGSGLSEDEDVVVSLGLRALWMKVEEAEKAEATYRESSSLAARHRGVSTAVLEVVEGETPGYTRFGLVVPLANRFQEDKILHGLQMALQNIVGSMVMEQELTKLSIMRLLEYLGKLINVAIKTGDGRKLQGVATALAETDGESIASILATLNTIAMMDEAIGEPDADPSDG
jgi:hypothetical protein